MKGVHLWWGVYLSGFCYELFFVMVCDQDIYTWHFSLWPCILLYTHLFRHIFVVAFSERGV
jgi:hypothetical protein